MFSGSVFGVQAEGPPSRGAAKLPPSRRLIRSANPVGLPCLQSISRWSVVSPFGLPLAGLMLVPEASTPPGHRLALCLFPTARQFPVPRAAIRAGGQLEGGKEKKEDESESERGEVW